MSEHKETRSTCCYCGVGCGVLISSDGEQITGVRGDPEHPANFGRLCSKGSQLHLTSTPLVQAQRRLQQPMLRHQRTDALTATDWDTSIAYVAQRIHRCVQEHGPDSIGFYVSGQLLTEDYFLFNKLARGLIGTNQIDSNSRLCMSSAVAGYKQSLGSDAPPCNYEDLDHADLVLIIGANPAYAHPVLYRRLEAARAKRPQMKLVVVDPRRTDSAQDADLHLAIKPGTDVALLNGLLHICFWEGWIQADWIAAHTSGFDALRDSVRHCTPEQTAAICGVSADDIYQLARWFAQSPASLSLYCQGLNQSSAGTAKNSALINLHLVTAQIGRAGAGPFSLTGQPNAMGGRETGSMANLLCGHRNLNSAEDRAEVTEFWGIPELPAQAGTTAVDMFEAARSGKIRILWIVCTNPAHSLPSQAQVRAALEAAELVIVQEAFRDTATCAYADVLLPAASWGEKEGTVTNSERRISRVRAAIAPAGMAKPDWWIASRIGQAIQAQMQEKQALRLDYPSSQEIWNEHRALTRGRDLDITGLSYALLEQEPQQWPCPEGQTTGKARLYTDFQFAHADGKARLICTPYQPAIDKINARTPFILSGGRLRDHWHGMSRTGVNPAAFAHQPEPLLEMHPQDMAARFLKDGDMVSLRNARGQQIWRIRANPALRSGMLWLPMHWGEEYVWGCSGDIRNLGANTLASPALDPQSFQPELKFASVQLQKQEFPFFLHIVSRLPTERIADVQRACRHLLRDLPYAECLPFGGNTTGISLFACLHQLEPAMFEALAEVFGFSEQDHIRYQDAQRSTRLIRLENRQLQTLMQTGRHPLPEWIRQWLKEAREIDMPSSSLLQDKAPAGIVIQRSAQICQCLGVSEAQISQFLSQQEAPATPEAEQKILQHLQKNLHCGTRCGSCVPELKQSIRNLRQKVLHIA
ncbi:nitrate reductase [Undibacterium luofuense]|uniref:Molybdopterin-dependent oxidoreductase n=1 Tax=Undibacterium luofuense TaxID=2828733 RepID=A0A941DLD9_9BURK|nr:nitrate reductase [Undibacterium luofuense]MBR7781744.1 molybdopterin-dependent oxidoreductase [Undibacterium luofuense]